MARLLKSEQVRLEEAGYVLSGTAYAKPNPVIHTPPPPSVPSASAKEELAEAAKKARAIVDGANRYLMKVHGQVRQQAQETLEKAREDGFMQGYEDGMKQGLAENEQTLARIVGLLQEIDKSKQAIFANHQQEIVDLALDIARKVVGTHLTKDDRAFRNIFKNATDGLYGHKTVRLMVSQHEAMFATASSDELRSMIAGAENMDIQVLEDAPPGTCILETEETLIDASASKQVEKLIQAVESVR